MKKKNTYLIIIGIAVPVLILAALAGWQKYSDFRRPNFVKETVLLVYPATTAQDVLDQLVDSSEVKRPASLERMFKRHGVQDNIKPGRYVIKPEYSSRYFALMLNNCWQTPTMLVLSGTIRTKTSLVKKISSQMMADSASVAAGLKDSALLASVGFDTTNVFSLFIPDSYQMYWTASVQEILVRMKKEYDTFWTDENKALALKQGLSQAEVSVLASIVSGETRYEPEMPSIAGVYLNRLHRGMKLQADPTVAYCFGYKLNRIMSKQTRFDSPYNTYRNYGLPPGPIAVPSKACLNAVLHPDTHAYLYFCASPDFNGTHRFAESYLAHQKNARAFQRALTLRQNKSTKQ